MATGTLANSALSAASATLIYTCPADTFAVVTVSVCNRGASASNIRLSAGNNNPAQAGDYIEFDTALSANGVLERTGIVLSAGQYITGYSSGADVDFVVYGIETSTA